MRNNKKIKDESRAQKDWVKQKTDKKDLLPMMLFIFLFALTNHTKQYQEKHYYT